MDYRFQTEIDEETESVRNMRILASLTRLSRVHVVSLQPHEHDFLDLRDFHNQNPEIFQPPPDYEMAQEIRKKEEEELPSYSQAVSNSTTNHMWYSSMQNWFIRDITPIHILSTNLCSNSEIIDFCERNKFTKHKPAICVLFQPRRSVFQDNFNFLWIMYDVLSTLFGNRAWELLSFHILLKDFELIVRLF